MFGYIRICKDELKVREYNLFRSYYCGLCKTLKSEYGFASRMGLSYDITFLVLLLSSLSDKPESICMQRCIANPFRKKSVVEKNQLYEYPAAVNVLLTVAKLKDDWKDEHSFRALFCLPLFWRSRQKAQKKYPGLYEKIKDHINTLSLLEKEKCDEIDKLAHEFGMVLQIIFDAPDLTENERRIFMHMGYCLGRFIYIADAYEDREKDKKEGSFNPFLLSDKPVDVQMLKTSLLFTLSDVSNSYQLLNIKRNRTILDNIIYLGLTESLEKVFGANLCKNEGELMNERSV